jgi:hypothetical protein
MPQGVGTSMATLTEAQLYVHDHAQPICQYG